ncbi:MAG: glycosyltransferase family 4 protein [Planctomycetes bacterium]|nr:glycosyltransferase family 4 protein [Planctomycetota bacterium]
MKIAQLTPGSGDNFYCENCLRDIALIKALRRTGHDITMIPMYLPLQRQKNLSGDTPQFFGGINVFLQQKFPIFRKTPRWIDSLLDSPKLLSWISDKSSMTSSKDLAETTISMLNGENGHQLKELNRLVEWLSQKENTPDIVCLSNILLAGFAKQIKQRLNIPVACLLQDEDGFLDALGKDYSKQAWQILSDRANDIDIFIAVSKYFADEMVQRLRIDKQKVRIVYTGVDIDKFAAGTSPPPVPTIGFLSRMCFDKGLDILVDAFVLIKKNENLKNAKMKIIGGKTKADIDFINKIEKKLDAPDILKDVEFISDFNEQTRADFLSSISVMSVPEKKPVAYGLYALESMASGVPVVQPATGVFNELIEITGGGVLYQPNTPRALADAITPLLLNPQRTFEIGRHARDTIVNNFNINQTAENIVELYKGTIK